MYHLPMNTLQKKMNPNCYGLSCSPPIPTTPLRSSSVHKVASAPAFPAHIRALSPYGPICKTKCYYLWRITEVFAQQIPFGRKTLTRLDPLLLHLVLPSSLSMPAFHTLSLPTLSNYHPSSLTHLEDACLS